MFCPTCQTVVWAALDTCPTCGGTMREVAAGDAVEVVEATAEVGSGEPAVMGAEAPVEVNALTLSVPAARFALPVPVRLAELSVAAWRQPAVRAAVKTGASALALSLAMSAARRALIRPQARRAVVRSVLPTLTDLLQPEAPNDHYGSALVVETFVYMRQVVVRR
ncbi:MAG TPA: hypothetical protein VKT52_07010 [Ktedonobacterales bacterium]|nr:hypothetical protein [Ktedonobacterales bacterium]